MKQFWFQIITLVIVIFVALYLYQNSGLVNNFLTPINAPSGSLNQVQIVEDSSSTVKATINVELANTQEKRAKGLGARDSLAKDSGMLFVFDQATKHQFWMKGMKFALDFIWVRQDRVVDLLPNIPPPAAPDTPDSSLPVYSSTVDVDKVLEVNAGFISTHNIKIGDRLKQI